VSYARLISLVLILSIAGLSSSFALCVAACTDEEPSGGESHACHDQTATLTVVAGGGACPHGRAIVPQGDITRDDRAPLTIAHRVVSLPSPVVVASAVHTRADARPPARPVSSPPILRI
jgi:hypothetical protein